MDVTDHHDFFTISLLRYEDHDGTTGSYAVPVLLAYLRCSKGSHSTAPELGLAFYEAHNRDHWTLLIDRHGGSAIKALREGFKDGSIALQRLRRYPGHGIVKETYDVTMAEFIPDWHSESLVVGDVMIPKRIRVTAPIQVTEDGARRYFSIRTTTENEEPVVPKTKGSVEVKSYIRKPGITEDVGPFDTEADALRTAQLLNAYGSADRDWEAYSVTTTTEEKIL